MLLVTRWLPLQSIVNTGADICPGPLDKPPALVLLGGSNLLAIEMLHLLRCAKHCTQGIQFIARSIFRQVKLNVAMVTDDL